MMDSYLYVIIALLPLAAGLVVTQKDPYHALVMRGILGAIAAMIYAVLGAADVALTEALVGTMLAITLYAIAVRSSLVMRLGVLEGDSPAAVDPSLDALMATVQTTLKHHYVRLEQVPYSNLLSLQRALADREVHGICVPSLQLNPNGHSLHLLDSDLYPYHLLIRVKRLYDIFLDELPAATTDLRYAETLNLPVTQDLPDPRNDLEQARP